MINSKDSSDNAWADSEQIALGLNDLTNYHDKTLSIHYILGIVCLSSFGELQLSPVELGVALVSGKKTCDNSRAASF